MYVSIAAIGFLVAAMLYDEGYQKTAIGLLAIVLIEFVSINIRSLRTKKKTNSNAGNFCGNTKAWHSKVHRTTLNPYWPAPITRRLVALCVG